MQHGINKSKLATAFLDMWRHIWKERFIKRWKFHGRIKHLEKITSFFSRQSADVSDGNMHVRYEVVTRRRLTKWGSFVTKNIGHDRYPNVQKFLCIFFLIAKALLLGSCKRDNSHGIPATSRDEYSRFLGFHVVSNGRLFLFVTSGPGAKAPGCNSAIRRIVRPVF
jgi:hypothetical protein